jgi:hypothetical protein
VHRHRMGVARQQLTQAMESPSFASASNELRGRSTTKTR